jgi:hypothetical protein
MSTYANTRRPNLLTLTLVLLAAAVTLATSRVDDGQTTGTSDTYEDWTAPRQRFDVVTQPISNRIDTFNYSGELSLSVTIGYVPEESESAPRWSIRMEEEGETFALTGDFDYLGGGRSTPPQNAPSSPNDTHRVPPSSPLRLQSSLVLQG